MITNIKIKNFKSISDLSADINGSVIILKGENGVGKSSFLQAVAMLLTGSKDKSVLTKGEKNGSISCKVDNYTIEYSFTEKSDRLKITDEKGMSQTTQSAIQSILKYKTFDISEFIGWSESAEGRRKQIAFIESVMSADTVEKIHNIKTDIATKKDERKALNDRISNGDKIVNNDIQKLPNWEEYFVAKPKDVTELLASVENANKKKNELSQLEFSLKTTRANFNPEFYDSKIKTNLDLIEEYKAKIAKIEQSNKEIETDKQRYIEEFNGNVKAYEEKIASIVIPDVPENINDMIAEANQFNSNIEKAVNINKNLKGLNAIKANRDAIENDIKTMETELADTIKNSDIPVPGLAFGDDGLTYNGLDFRNGVLSDSEIMEVAVLLGLSANKSLPIVTLGRGESLGSKRFQQIVNIVRKNNAQIFIEQVERDQENLVITNYTEEK